MKATITISISANRITTEMLEEAINDVLKFNVNDESDLLGENSRIMHNSALSGDKDMSWVIDVADESSNPHQD